MAEYEERKSFNKKLEPYIKGFTQVLGRRPAKAKDVMPSAGSSMIFAFEKLLFNKEIFLNKAVTGFHTEPFHFESFSDSADSFTIKFSPYGLSRFIDVPLDTLTNKITETSLLFGKDVDELYQNLQQTILFTKRIALAEEYLLKRFKEPTEIEKTIFYFADELRRTEEGLSLDELRKHIPLSARQLERKFKALIGTDIQTFIRILRCRSANLLFQPEESLSLTPVGFEIGYVQRNLLENFSSIEKYTCSSCSDNPALCKA